MIIKERVLESINEIKTYPPESQSLVINSIGYGILGMIGEGLQALNQLKLTNYSLLDGHLSDFSYAAFLNSMLYKAVAHNGQNKLLNAVSFGVMPLVMTLSELIASNTDEKDIIAYWLGGIAGALTTKLGSKMIKKFNTIRLEERI